jgi:hypothetical protein
VRSFSCRRCITTRIRLSSSRVRDAISSSKISLTDSIWSMLLASLIGSGSSTTMKSARYPVMVPSIDVAKTLPFLLVPKSPAPFHFSSMRVLKLRWNGSDSKIRRMLRVVSRASFLHARRS